MESDHRTASRELWSGAAEGWAADAEHRERGPAGAAAEWMIDAADLGPGKRVLELACGAGDVGLRAAALVGPEGCIVCSDFARPMVELVEERAAALGLPQVEGRVVDAEAMDELRNQFDAVLCRFGYMLMPDPSKALRGSFTALRPGGRLALAVWGSSERNPWLSSLTDAVMTELGAPPPEPGTPGPFALHAHVGLRKLLSGAGFEDLAIEDLVDTRRYDSLDEWWSGRQDVSGPIGSLLNQLPEDQLRAIRDAALARASRYTVEDGTLSFPTQIVVAGGRRPD